MENSETNTNSKSKGKFQVIGAIFISILSSALWEKLVSPLLTYLYEMFINLSNSISMNYSNQIYYQVSRGYQDHYSQLIFKIIILVTGFILFYYTLPYKKIILKLRSPLLYLFLTFILFQYVETIFINNRISYALRNIEIISPYVSDNDYKILKSKFYSVIDSEDYNSLIIMINDIRIKNDLSEISIDFE